MAAEDNRVMRDVIIEEITTHMATNDRIFFLSADFGSPALDLLRDRYKDRFINVGIAEQNLIAVSTGLALEGSIVYAYGIAPFLSMRCYEQIRVDLALLGQTRSLNVNLISVGAGLSYDMSGPTHHCLEDLSLLRTLPNITLFSPSDWVLAKRFVEYSLSVNQPKYLRLDGKRVPRLYEESAKVPFEAGFSELEKGDDLCLVATGYSTHLAREVREELLKKGCKAGIVDVFMLTPLDEERLASALRAYRRIVTLEEGFINRGGLDSLILHLLRRHHIVAEFRNYGCASSYVFESGDRKRLQTSYGLDVEAICRDACKVAPE